MERDYVLEGTATISHQQVMSPKLVSTTFDNPASQHMLRRRRTMEHGDPSQLALPDVANQGAEEKEERLKEEKKEEIKEEMKKGLTTPPRSTTGPPESATGPTTELEVFRSGGSKESMKESAEPPNKGRPVTLAPLAPPQLEMMQPLFTKEQMKEARAAARQAPQVFGKAPPPSSSEEQLELLQRPAFLREEEEERLEGRKGRRKEAPGSYEEEEGEELRRCDEEASEDPRCRHRSRLQEEKEEEIMWRWQMSQDMKKLTSLYQEQQRENDRLQQELYEWRLENAEEEGKKMKRSRRKRKRNVMSFEVHRRLTPLKKRSLKH